MTDLIFDYPANAKIRIKKCNCYVHDNYPCVYRIITKKLDFLIPRKFTIFGKSHVFIPSSYYQTELSKYYKSITNETLPDNPSSFRNTYVH